MNKQTLQIPPPELLPDFEKPLPDVFVADEAFRLLENLMRPYPKRNIKNKIFNYRLSACMTNSRTHVWYIGVLFSCLPKTV